MSDIIQSLPHLPLWLTIPIVVVALVLTMWPKVFQLYLDLSAEQRAFRTEKQRLEVLKLRTEIEVLQKAHGLQRPDDKLWIPPTCLGNLSTILVSDAPPMSIIRCFFWGGIGGVLPYLIRLTQSETMFGTSVIQVASYITMVAGFLLGGVGGVFLVDQTRATRKNCLFVGLATVAILLALIAAPTTRFK